MLSLGAKAVVFVSALSLSGVVGIETSVAFTSSGVSTASAAQPSSSASASTAFIPDAVSRVNLFVGTTNGGHVFPGA